MKFSVRSSNKKSLIPYLYLSTTLLLCAAFVLSIMFGSTRISMSAALDAILNSASGTDARILLYVRLPRTLGCILAGAALSVAGAVIQAVLSNSLASPGIIGVNSGAGLAVTVCASVGIFGGWKLSLAAFAGAAVAALAVSTAAARLKANAGVVILMGVAVNSLLGAVSDAIAAFDPTLSSMTVDFRIGDFSSVTYTKLLPTAVIVMSSLLFTFTMSNYLDVLRLGDDVASGLGLNTGVTRTLFLLLMSLLAGSAVSIAGLLSFVGLLVPHAVKRLGISSPKHLLPLCAVTGGSFVTLCDLASRTLFAPHEIPVGIIMSVIGVPVFVLILLNKKERSAL